MIKKIGISNFKAFGDFTEIELGALSLFSGLNSSGKSSIYQALFLIAQSSSQYIEDEQLHKLPFLSLNGDLAHLGQCKEILHDKTKRYVKFSLEWHDNTKIKYIYSLDIGEYNNKNREKDDTFVLSSIEYCYEGEFVFSASYEDSKWKVSAKNLLMFADYEIRETLEKIVRKSPSYAEGDDVFCEIVSFDSVYQLDLKRYFLETFKIKYEDVVKTINPKYRHCINFEELKKDLDKNECYSEYLMLVSSTRHRWILYNLDFNDIVYLPPFRGYPKRVYVHNVDDNPLFKYNREMKSIVRYDYDLENMSPISATLEESFNYWVVDHFNLCDRISIDEPIDGLVTEIFLWKNGVKIPINNIGFGASQIIPIIFNILFNDERYLYIIDEPEIHLHPSVQSKLADFFFKMALAGKTIFLETHSEYLIDKLIYLSIKHGFNNHDRIKLNWVKPNNKQSEIERINYDDLGFLINAPAGFLSEKQNLVKEINQLRMAKM